MQKVVENHCVAVLVSPGFGAGWGSWNKDHPHCVFDPAVVGWVRTGKLGEPPVDHLGEHFCSSGAYALIIQWVPVGTRFVIDEYDGSEHLVLESDIEFYTA
jgi:hypothetical protein